MVRTTSFNDPVLWAEKDETADNSVAGHFGLRVLFMRQRTRHADTRRIRRTGNGGRDRTRSERSRCVYRGIGESHGTDFSVKAPIEDSGETEHFWLTDIVYRDGEFQGLIGNDPGMVTNVKLGQRWTIQKSEISDWMFMRDGKIHGNYTMRPLLKTMPEEEAQRFRSMLADP
jgi:uncharacterized protein YegJ (DUF2314 family)